MKARWNSTTVSLCGLIWQRNRPLTGEVKTRGKNMRNDQAIREISGLYWWGALLGVFGIWKRTQPRLPQGQGMSGIHWRIWHLPAVPGPIVHYLQYMHGATSQLAHIANYLEKKTTSIPVEARSVWYSLRNPADLGPDDAPPTTAPCTVRTDIPSP